MFLCFKYRIFYRMWEANLRESPLKQREKHDLCRFCCRCPARRHSKAPRQLQHTLETVEYKCWFYEAAKAAGTVDVPGAMTDADVPDQFRAIRQKLRGQKIPNGEK